MDIKGQNISVIGAVRSGVAAAKLIKKVGGNPFVSDSGNEAKLLKSINEMKEFHIKYEIGLHSERVFECKLMVVSPGVPSNSEVIIKAKEKNINIISEIELASYFCKGNIIAITGTNGKTTTTSLCGYVFNQCGYKTYIAGNIGNAFSEIVLDVNENEFVSLEVSSFQLDYIIDFKPKIAIILNIAPDHLNRYDNNYQNYTQSKFRIFENQKEDDYLISNYDDPLLNNLSNEFTSKYYLSIQNSLDTGCYSDGNKISFTNKGLTEFECNVADLKLLGEHNVYNSMAVITAAKIFNLDNNKIISAIKEFDGVEHRLEFVREINGIKFINDSKATNVNSVKYALKSFDKPIHLILGGLDKGNDYTEIEELIKTNVKKIYAIGSSADKIKSYFENIISVEINLLLGEAIRNAFSNSSDSDVVLLSPACASFDMFENYEDRGNQFKKIVDNL